MILRRFMKHVTDQNWLAVGLDVLVVITGIFLGMQVTEWNEERKVRVEEKQYVLRLLSDAETSLHQMQGILKEQKDSFDELQWAINHLEAGTLDSEKFERFEYLFVRMTGWRQLIYYTDTLEELISTGRLTIFRSEKLRGQISRFRVELDLYGKRAALIGSNMVKSQNELTTLISMDSSRTRIITPMNDINTNRKIFDLFNYLARKDEGLIHFSRILHERTKVFKSQLQQTLKEYP